MTVHYARIIGLAAVLVGISTFVPGTRLHGQPLLDDLPLDELRVRAEQGDTAAQDALGFRYLSGRGVPQDEAEAIRWFRLTAEQGDAVAQANLGSVYDAGRGVPQDFAEAVRWFRLAAEQGNAIAQFNLGNMYASGRGVPQDDVEAHTWFNLAAARSSGEGRDAYGQRRDAVAARMTREQIAEAQRRARGWKPTSEP